MNEIEEILNKESKKITKKNGMNKPFFIEVTKGVEDEYSVALKKGNPPTIYVNYYLVNYSLKQNNSLRFLKDRLERAIEKVPIMTWNLSNEPPAEAIALRKDATRWIKANSFDAFVRLVSEASFKVTFSATVEIVDRLTGMSITLSGSNPYELEREAKRRLTQSILESEKKAELEEFLEMTSPKIIDTKPSVPETIIITDDLSKKEIIEDYKYE